MLRLLASRLLKKGLLPLGKRHVARTIVQTYGGRIWAENRAAGGTVFRFTLPLAERGPT
jgi:signal transduction histidine kinase